MANNAVREATPPTLWSIEEVAEFLQVPVKTLYQWRYKQYGPRSHRIGRHVRYFPEQVRSWVEDQD